ncbi:MAG: hypothetical protein COA96_06900 [SAR86 cluster bacterium]|uniref:UmuC domain-containing protein n=1 Tax=SAR86 cluster bacterium TaxID=2030880 RepID=A0A2A5B3S5_9GAMM|nr:MAG: hypothetical protein COA96_06900 [SAR86 cluster bacterium]
MEDPDEAARPSLQASPDKLTSQVVWLPHDSGPAPPAANTAISTNGHGANNLWYALYFPQLAELGTVQQKKHLNELAGLMQCVSSTISFHPLALICEIRSSLKYFTSIDVIHNKLQQSLKTQLEEWGLVSDFLYAASPTITGSLLLARSGHNTLVYQKDNLRSALGELPTEVLELDKEQNRRLHNMGIRYLKDIWRLPSDGLRKRFGSSFVNQLSKALGKAPEPTINYLPPPAFNTAYELPYEIENLDRLLPIADEMLAQLCDFLQRRDLSTSHLLFSLSHEKRSPTKVEIGLRQSSRSQKHLMLLLETHFNKLIIPAPIIAIKIDVRNFDAFFGYSDSLLEKSEPATRQYNDSNLDRFIEQLQARLGENHVKGIDSVAEHCPEHASQLFDLDNLSEIKENRNKIPERITENLRPFWLLQNPVQLTLRKGRLYHRRRISIVSGPERIETYWWSGVNVRRDYYVAREANGSRLWIYREKTAEKNWYLHGVFS